MKLFIIQTMISAVIILSLSFLTKHYAIHEPFSILIMLLGACLISSIHYWLVKTRNKPEK